ncbi:calvin cycle protein CP12-2, chloroplastic [Cajanus cajan]|uniref:Calvin cycle protein CP12 n=1 Tax=Cajanus cajan TaxID=3821 RepID=A0A151RYE5_CAJCA|nr:calvin cycle protein CP12-2, chloroplastic [Cajanus cajan]KYP47576.1 Calvin cycle protein CP12 [Cajanus cajan]
MATTTGVSLSSPRVLFKASVSPQSAHAIKFFAVPLGQGMQPVIIRSGRVSTIQPIRAVPEKISEKVEESIKNAQETCAGDPTSGECVAAWDEVEELSAAASHARDKQKEKDSDPLENYCKDNPETIECKTFDE